VDVWLVGAGDGQTDRFGPGRKQQPVVRNSAFIRQDNLTRTGIDVHGFCGETQVDVVLGIEFLSSKRDPVLWGFSGEVILGEIRPVDGRCLVVAEHDDAAFKLLSPQHFGRGETRRAAAYNDDFPWGLARASGARFRSRPFEFVANENPPIPLFDSPAGERIEGRSMQRFARSQIKARMVPGAADCVIRHKAVDKRPAVMRTCGANREHLGSAAHQ